MRKLAIPVAAAVTVAGLALPATASAAAPAPASTPVEAPAKLGSGLKRLAPDPSIAAAEYRKWFSSVKGQPQKKANWCGPAAAATALSGWTGVGLNSQTQAYLAQRMGTDKIGFTSPIAMGRELTDYINKKTNRTGVKYQAYKYIKNQNLWEGVRGAYYYNTGPIILVISSKKSWYPSAPSGMAHYVVIWGFDDTSMQEAYYRVYDPQGKNVNGKAVGVNRWMRARDWERIAYVGRFVVSGKNTPF